MPLVFTARREHSRALERLVLAASLCAGLAAGAVPAAVSVPDSAAGEEDATAEETATAKGFRRHFHWEMASHPRLRIGELVRLDFRFQFRHDFRSFDPEISGQQGETCNLSGFRFAVEGRVTQDFEFEIERETKNEAAEWLRLSTNETHATWRDVFGNFRHYRRLQFRFGQFKIPFGMDQQQGPAHRDFVFRSLIGQFLAPGRDLGGMLHGRVFEHRVQYEVGLFAGDGWRAHLKDYSRSGERAIAGRLAAAPLEFVAIPRFLKPLRGTELGIAVVQNPITEGLRSLRGRTWVDTHNYFDRINVRGHRLRLGTELNFANGPFSVKGEIIRVSDQRLGQGLRGQDLPDLISRGWYLAGTWLLTGEKKVNVIKPKRDFITGRGLGAVEFAARYEQIRFGSAEHPGLPSRSSRAANIYSESERVATFGVNWFLNRFMRIQYNAIREVIEDVQNAPIPGVGTYWSRYVRMQFVL